MILKRDWMSVVMTYFKERYNYEKQEISEPGIDLWNFWVRNRVPITIQGGLVVALSGNLEAGAGANGNCIL